IAGQGLGDGAFLGMARKRTQLAMSATAAAQLKEQIRAATDPRDKERMQVVLWATSGQPTLAELAGLAGRARSTIQVWLEDFTAGGLAQLLEREAPPGKPSPVAGAKVQAELQAGLKAGHWRTAGQVAAWLQKAHGIQRAAKSLYYWLGKVGGALRVPRPCHVQQNPAAVAAFRAELEQNLEKLDLPEDRTVKIGWGRRPGSGGTRRAAAAGRCGASGWCEPRRNATNGNMCMARWRWSKGEPSFSSSRRSVWS